MTNNAGVFDDDKKPQDQAGNPSNDLFADKLMAIKNEDGKPKYKSVEDALEALAHSQQFIEQLKSENGQMTKAMQEAINELEKRQSVEDVVDKLLNRQAKPSDPPTDPSKPVNGVDEKKVMELIESTLTRNQTAAQQTANLNLVTEELSKLHGDKTKEFVSNRAKELGTTTAKLKEMAAENPQIFLALMGNKGTVSSTPSQTSVNPRPQDKNKNKLPEAPKGIMRGAKTEDVLAHWRAIKEHTYKQYGVET